MVIKMKENKLVDLSMEFAVLLLDFVQNNKIANRVIINQIIRSGTSIGANIHEAQYAHGKFDFIAKLEIALKETNETSYWLDLLSNKYY
jgi:four helix bundle protein